MGHRSPGNRCHDGRLGFGEDRGLGNTACLPAPLRFGCPWTSLWAPPSLRFLHLSRSSGCQSLAVRHFALRRGLGRTFQLGTVRLTTMSVRTLFRLEFLARGNPEHTGSPLAGHLSGSLCILERILSPFLLRSLAHLLDGRLSRLRASPTEGAGQGISHDMPYSRSHSYASSGGCHLSHKARLARSGRCRGGR